MGRSVVIEPEEQVSGASTLLETDERWQVAKRAVTSRHLSRSPLLSNFLLYIVAETIHGRSDQITEHEIGVNVFDRPVHYRTLEDNIVRSYARQLRRRLSDYFLREGCSERLRIEIPLGGYIPVFTDREENLLDTTARFGAEDGETQTPSPGNGLLRDRAGTTVRPSRSGILAWFFLLMGYTVAVCAIGWWIGRSEKHDIAEPARFTAAKPLWDALFSGPSTTYIVPADAGLNIIEDLSQRPMRLVDYVGGDYGKTALPQVDSHSATDLRTQNFTSFVDLQIASSLSRLPQFNPQRAIFRFPRDLRLDDLKNANAIILGSSGSNPWAAIDDSKANFRIVYRDGMGSATIVNAHPLAGEMTEYLSHWNEPAHETFALISFLPSLNGEGHLLLIQGLDVAGTQAAGEALFRPELISPILRRAMRPDGTLRNFEVLLRASSIESSATGTSIVTTRIY